MLSALFSFVHLFALSFSGGWVNGWVGWFGTGVHGVGRKRGRKRKRDGLTWATHTHTTGKDPPFGKATHHPAELTTTHEPKKVANHQQNHHLPTSQPARASQPSSQPASQPARFIHLDRRIRAPHSVQKNVVVASEGIVSTQTNVGVKVQAGSEGRTD